MSGAAFPRLRFLRQVFDLAGPYWNSRDKRRIRAATLLLLLLTVAQVAISVWGNFWNRALFDALGARSVPGVLVQVAVFALILVVSMVVTALHLLVKRWLQLDWRAWLTDQLVRRWMDDGRHYRLLFNPGEHDNPDQRIAEDIRIATESAISLAHTLIYSLLTLALFIDILWTVSGSMNVPGTAVEVPGYLVPLAFLYAGIGTALGWIFGRPLVRSTNALQSAEASFRFGLARAREHAEAIALLHGEPLERAGSARKFTQLVRDWNRQSFAYLGLVSLSTAYGGLLPVFPILVAAPQYILGAMTLGGLMQAAQAFQRLTSALSWPVDNVGEIARCRTSAGRVLSLYADMQRLDAEGQTSRAHRIVVGWSPDRRLVIEDLCIEEPAGRILLDKFSIEVRRGERVLIAGDSAVTSGLFKAIGGLWTWGSGRILLPKSVSMLFMPHRPFLPEGSLRQALCYPQAADAYSDKTIHYALECAGVAWLAPRLDEQNNWEAALPLRAQQRLGFARAVLQRPAWIFLHEATDTFDPGDEQHSLEMLRHELPDTAIVTLSFRPGLEHWHDRRIVLTRATEANGP